MNVTGYLCLDGHTTPIVDVTFHADPFPRIVLYGAPMQVRGPVEGPLLVLDAERRTVIESTEMTRYSHLRGVYTLELTYTLSVRHLETLDGSLDPVRNA